MNLSIAFKTALVLNILWFGMAFWLFSLKPDRAARILVPKSAHEHPLFKTISASVRFLGGMNLTFSVFAILLLANSALFPEPKQIALFAGVFSLAHASQFAFNVPLALGGGRQGEALWPVLNGPMFFIFLVDFLLMMVNGVLSITALTIT